MKHTKRHIEGTRSAADGPRYNHMFVLAFTVISDDERGEDVTETDYRRGLLRRIVDLDANHEWSEAIGGPDDTYEMPTPEWEWEQDCQLWRGFQRRRKERQIGEEA